MYCSAVEESDNLETAWGILEVMFIPICDKHAPFKNMKIPNQPPPCFDDEYLTLRKELQNIKSVAHKSSFAENWYGVFHDILSSDVAHKLHKHIVSLIK